MCEAKGHPNYYRCEDCSRGPKRAATQQAYRAYVALNGLKGKTAEDTQAPLPATASTARLLAKAVTAGSPITPARDHVADDRIYEETPAGARNTAQHFTSALVTAGPYVGGRPAGGFTILRVNAARNAALA